MEKTSTIAESKPLVAAPTLRRITYRLLETAASGDRASRIVDLGLVALICVSVAAVILESIKQVEIRWSATFYWLEVVTVSIFTVEYLLRVWCCVETTDKRFAGQKPLQLRLRYMLSFHAVVDLFAILPFYIMLYGLFGVDMRFLRAIRLLRVLKLTRYSAAIDMLLACIVENGKSLAASFLILLIIMLMAAAGMYYFERTVQPLAFSSIPSAMWWAFVTLTTVGYGDVVPITTGGKVFGAFITVIGIGMVALPTGILASGYAQQLALRQAQYRHKADQALDDGVLTDSEISSLDKLRRDLGLGRNTASQILDAGKVQRALALERASMRADYRCPHCGRGPIDAD